jgi:Pyruvate/2-oxoacid:ferredoxin oxidoreductase gamma subunit
MAPQSSRKSVRSWRNYRRQLARFVRPLCEQLEGRIAPALFNVQTPLAFTGLNNNGCVATGDLNKDGFMDAVLTNFGTDYSSGAGNSIAVLYGKSGGGFNKLNFPTGGTNVSFVTIADINGDTWLDVVASNANGQNTGSFTVFRNTGVSPQLSTLQQVGSPYSSFGNNASWVGLADVTGDGILDAIVAHFGKDDGNDNVVGQKVTIFAGNADTQGKGDFTFATSPTTTLAPEIQFIPTALAVADFNGDGKKDIAAAVPGVPPDFNQPQVEGVIYLFKGNGAGGFDNPTQVGTGGALPVNIQAADLNNDNKPDLIVANAGDPNATPEFTNDSVGVLFNVSSSETISFSPPNSLTANTYGTFAVAIADFDQDSDQDIAAINYGSQSLSPEAFVSVYLGNGQGSFSPASPGTYNTGTTIGGGQYLAVGTFDNNSSPDLIVAHASNLVGLLLNTSTAAPAVTINQGAGQADPTNGSSIVFDVVFSEGVTGFTNTDIDLSSSSLSGLSATVTQLTTSTYTVTVTGMTGTGTVVAKIPAGAATSIASGTASLASTSSDNQVTFDSVGPTVTINQAAGQADPTSVGPINFTVVFSENVTGFGSNDVDLSQSTLSGLTATVTQNTPSNYTVAVSGMSGEGVVIAKVVAGAATDAAGNSSAASTSTDNSVTFGNPTAPTVTINQGGSQPDPTKSSPIVFDVVFSEGVSGFTGSDIDFTGSSVGGLTANVTQLTPSTYTVSVTGMSGTGLVKASIPAGAATAISSGLNSVASTSNDNEVRFDFDAPTVTINQAAGQADPTSTGPILFTVVFSEDVTGFGNSDVDLSASSLSGLTATVTQNTPSNYTVSVSGMTGDGTVVAKVVAGAAADAAGNSSSASTSTDNSVRFDSLAPTVTINQASGQADPTAVPSISFDVKFSENVTGFTSADVSLNGSTVGGTLSVNVTGSLDTYVVTVTGMTTSGVVVATIPAGGAADGAGNTNLASTSSDNSVAFVNNGVIGFKEAEFQAIELDGTDIYQVTITVTRSGATGGEVSIDYNTADVVTGAHSGGSANGGQADYTPTSGRLTWANGVGGDQTFTVDILADAWNEGRERINLTLSNPQGSPGLGLTSAAIVIAPSDGQGPGTYIDSDGDLVKIKLGGRTGWLEAFRTDPDGNGAGPIELIMLHETLPDPLRPRASLAVKVKKSITSTDGGTVGIGAIVGPGLKAISAPKANLTMEGILLDGYVQSIKIGSILNGADIITLPTANPAQTTRIKAFGIGDGTVIDVGARLSSLNALSFGASLLTVPSVGAIKIRSDMKGDIDITGIGVPPTMRALGSLKVKGVVTGSDIFVDGHVGSVVVGAFRNSRLFAGYTGDDDGDGTFIQQSSVAKFKTTGGSDAFQNSRVIATYIGSATITALDPTNSGKFGFYADNRVSALTVVLPQKFVYDPNSSDPQGMGDFEVRIV